MDAPAPLLLRGLTARPRATELTLSHRELLGRRLLLNSLARFLVSLIFLVGALLAMAVDFLEADPAFNVVILGLIIALYNVPIFFLARRYQAPEASAVSYPRVRAVMYVAIVADYLALAVLVAIMGGARSPFLAFYLLHVTLSCIMLPRWAAVAFTALAYVLIGAQVGMEWAGILPSRLPFAHGIPAAPLDGRTALEILLVYGALLAFTDALLISLAEWLRRSEQELREKNRQLGQLSRLRRDFLHVAVHNLRSPVGAAVQHLDNLASGLAGPLEEKQQEWVDRSRKRLDRLLDLLQDMKILGDLETENLREQAERVRLPELIRQVVEDYQEMADQEGLILVPEIHEPTPCVWGIPRLLREAVANFVTNAIRYAPGSGPVTVSVKNLSSDGVEVVRVSVTDRGPGIAPEHQERLFEEFSRPPDTRDSRRIKSTGLGLSIVRRIIEAHGGRVGVDSEPGEGSTFFFDLPPVTSADLGPEQGQ